MNSYLPHKLARVFRLFTFMPKIDFSKKKVSLLKPRFEPITSQLPSTMHIPRFKLYHKNKTKIK